MFNPFRKKSFLEKCSDSVLGGLAAVGDVVVATGEIVGDAVDAITTPTTKRETVIIQRPVVVERRTVVTTNSWAECEARRLRQETMRLREENLRLEHELTERRRREAEYETAKVRLEREHEARMNATRVVLNEVVTSKRGNKYRVQLLLKGSEYKVLVKIYDLGIPVWESTFYDAKSAYDAFSSHRIIIKTIK